jgi:hypothetical protein
MAEASEKSRLVALVLSSTFGWMGAHRFYAGKIGTGVLMALTGGGLGIWWAFDTIMIATGAFRDIDHRPLLYWSEAETRPGAEGDSAEMWEEIDGLRAEVRELSERVDYSERMLTRGRSEDMTA